MKEPPLPSDEESRLADLASYEVLDTEPEEGFDALVRLASFVTQRPVALVSFVDSDRQWFKARVGLETSQTPRDVSFCGHAILGDGLFVVTDAAKHPDFCDNPLVLGEPKVVFYAGAPLRSENGHRLGTLCVIDHKPGELSYEQAQALKDVATQVVALLEMRKQGRVLRDANRELQTQCHARSHFISNLSHEIRTPLNAISGALQLSLLKPWPEAERRLLDVAHTSSNTVIELVNNILDLSKLEAGKLKVHPTAVSSDEITREVVAMFGGRAELASVALSLELPSHPPPAVLIDSLRLKQVLMNLIGNALKFTDEGGSVRVTHQVESRAGGRACLLSWRIADSGIGMDKRSLARLGRPFQQAGPDITHKFGGTGLGVSIVREILGQMRGRLHYESVLGRGTTATVQIEVDVVGRAAPEPAFEVEARQPLSILVVDHIPTNRFILCNMLRGWGYLPTEADSGRRALELIDECSPDLMLIDLQMPDFGEFEVWYKSKGERERLRTIALLGGAADHDCDTCMRAEFDGYLLKPIDKLRLESTIEEVRTKDSTPGGRPCSRPPSIRRGLAGPFSNQPHSTVSTCDGRACSSEGLAQRDGDPESAYRCVGTVAGIAGESEEDVPEVSVRRLSVTE